MQDSLRQYSLDRGKELRLKQQYFWVAASLFDIIRRFKKSRRPWIQFPNQVAIQLNDTHPALAIVELQRILIDREGLEWGEAWPIVTQTFGYTCHSLLPEALEKWSVPLLQKLLPRHFQIICDINFFFLEYVQGRFPKDRDLLSRVSIIEGKANMVRTAYLAIVGSHKVNGVSELQSDLIVTTIFKDFVQVFGPDKFTNITNGVTPRRWLHQANPRLSELIASKIGGNLSYLKDLSKLAALENYVDDEEFRKEWREIKYANKVRLAKHIKSTTGISVNPAALFDIQVKRIHEV